MSHQMIPVDSILDPEWNSRLYVESKTETAEIQELADSIKTEGQLQDIIVERVLGTPAASPQYLLVIGSRRLRAVKLNGTPEIGADVRDATDESTRVIQNIAENVKRKDLSQFEQARACVKLMEVGLKGEEVGRRLGFSKQKVSNLAVSYRELQVTPRILDAWRTEQPAATVDFLRELASTKAKTPAERIKKIEESWEARVKLLDKADAIIDPPAPDPKERSKKKPDAKDDPPFKVPAQRYFDLVKAITKSKVAGGQLAVMCAKYLIGETDKVKGIIEPEAEEKD